MNFFRMKTIFCALSVFLLAPETGLTDEATGQNRYDAMFAVFDVCVSNARTGTVMTEAQVIATAGIDDGLVRRPELAGFRFSFELHEHFMCGIWTSAAQIDPYDFRAAVDEYVASLPKDAGGGASCVWRPVFPKNECFLPGMKVEHQSGWEYNFDISFHIVAHQFVLLAIKPGLSFDPDGKAHLL